MAFFTASRMGRSQWSAGRVSKHYFIRGVLLLVIGRFVNPPFAIVHIVDHYEVNMPLAPENFVALLNHIARCSCCCPYS